MLLILESVLPVFNTDELYSKRLKLQVICVLKDFQELIHNANNQGYRHNSYLLNMISLKLTFIYELMKKFNPEVLKHEMTTIAEVNYSISLMLCKSHAEYIDNFQ